MDRPVSISSSVSGISRSADLPVSSPYFSGAGRRMNFTPGCAKTTVSAPSTGKSHAAAASRGMTPPHRQEGAAINSSAGQEYRTGNALSYSRVQAAGGAQGSLGKEPDYWSYTAPLPPSAAHRALSFCSKYDMHADYLEPASQTGGETHDTTGNIERILGTSHLPPNKKAGPPESPNLHQAEANARDEGGQLGEQGPLQGDQDWEEPEEEKDQEYCSDGVAEALWEKRIPQTSTQYPICTRTPRERCAYTTSDDWAIFALHNQYVRPIRDREWVPGEPCIIRRNSFELPPGACRYSESACGVPATAFDSFVFPNPPRQFLMSARGRTSGNVDFALPSSYFRKGASRSGARGRCSQLTQQQLLDLERMLWFDPEPRLERPFRLYADSKTCLKGRLHDIGHIMRSGW